MAKYDLNVWNKVGYETDYVRDGWEIAVYECDDNWNHSIVPTQIITLSETQVEMLTLGKSPDEGGDYDWDTDFWIDPAGFLDTYKSVPRKVRRYLEALV